MLQLLSLVKPQIRTRRNSSNTWKWELALTFSQLGNTFWSKICIYNINMFWFMSCKYCQHFLIWCLIMQRNAEIFPVFKTKSAFYASQRSDCWQVSHSIMMSDNNGFLRCFSSIRDNSVSRISDQPLQPVMDFFCTCSFAFSRRDGRQFHLPAANEKLVFSVVVGRRLPACNWNE